jgi:sarcosine oxidase, subunit gamma
MNVMSHIPPGLAEPAPGPVSLRFLPQVARWSLRIDPAHLPAASETFGVRLPARIGEIAASGSRRALCLGPDEWVLWADEAEAEGIEAASAALYADTAHSLVSTSDREVAVEAAGPDSLTLLSVGCPIDLARIPVGSGKRTVIDNVQVVLVREAPDRWTLDVWRSFAPHLWDLLNTGNRELAAGL